MPHGGVCNFAYVGPRYDWYPATFPATSVKIETTQFPYVNGSFTFNNVAIKKKSYCGYPAPPIPAGMSDFCARQYDFYCRRGVGCNQFGR